jgi:hypothetical protein
MLGKEGICKSESLVMKQCEPGYMFQTLTFVGVLCFPVRHGAGAEKYFRGLSFNFLSHIKHRIKYTCKLIFPPKHNNYLSRATGPSATSRLAAEITLFCTVFVSAYCWQCVACNYVVWGRVNLIVPSSSRKLLCLCLQVPFVV